LVIETIKPVFSSNAILKSSYVHWIVSRLPAKPAPTHETHRATKLKEIYKTHSREMPISPQALVVFAFVSTSFHHVVVDLNAVRGDRSVIAIRDPHLI
jgi:hypothetical protein